jgi:hypothetical protein
MNGKTTLGKTIKVFFNSFAPNRFAFLKAESLQKF